MVGITTLYVVLARLQQITTLGLFGAAIAWAIYMTGIGRQLWAAAGVLLILFGYVAILGLEFVLMQWANRRDPFPAARLSEVGLAWISEVRCAPLVFCWRQPFRSHAHADRLTGTPGQRGLVLVHGFVCNRGLWNSWYPKLEVLGIPFVGVNLEPVFGDIDDYADQVADAVAALRQSTGLAPVIVAHSMGGLAVRAWLRHAGPGGLDQAHHIVTLGTPHGGTALARFGFSSNSRQMMPAGLWLAALASSAAQDVDAKISCVFSNCDNIVFPTSTAVLANARKIHIPACAHVQMVDHPLAFAQVLGHLTATS